MVLQVDYSPHMQIKEINSALNDKIIYFFIFSVVEKSSET